MATHYESGQREAGNPSLAARLRQRFQQAGLNRSSLDVAGRFSLLRTRLLQEMGRQGARRLGVCPITEGAGATYVAANLALATARLSHLDVLLVDLALGHPSMAAQLGLQGDARFLRYLEGEDIRPEDCAIRIESEGNLTCLMPDAPSHRAAEILQDEDARGRLGTLVSAFDCELAIFDLSPVLDTDEGLAALPMMDAILLVADGRAGTGRDVADCQRLMADMPPLLGVVLNKAELLG